MRDWNVVVSVREGEYTRARQLLRQLGRVQRTSYYNVLAMTVSDVAEFTKDLSVLSSNVPELMSAVSRVAPVSRTFEFESVEDFEVKARECAMGWLPELANKSFHVRFHRRGLRERMSSQEEERFLDGHLLSALAEAGTPGSISFDDPDVILSIETIGNRAGMSLWTRDDLVRYPFLKLD